MALEWLNKIFGKKTPSSPDQTPSSNEEDELDDDEEDLDSEDEENDDEDDGENEEDEDDEDEDDDDEEEIEYSREQQERINRTLEAKHRNIQLPPHVNAPAVETLISNLVHAQKKLRQFEGGQLGRSFVRVVAEIQTQIRSELDRGGALPGEAEVILQNISIDIEAQLSRGSIENRIYNSFNKLGEINIYNSQLAETLNNLPGAKTVQKYLPNLYRMGQQGLSARRAFTALVIGAGGVLGGGLIVTILGAAAGAWAGHAAAKGYARRRAERDFNEEMQELSDVEEKGLFIGDLEPEEIKELRKIRRKILETQSKGKEPKEKEIQRRDELERKVTDASVAGDGIANLTDKRVKYYAVELLKGAHRFEKAIGLKADGSIDRDSIPAKLLRRLDEDQKKEIEAEFKDVVMTMEEMSQEVDDEIADATKYQRSLLIKSLFGGLRLEQIKEERVGVAGAALGGFSSVLLRALMIPFKGQTFEEGLELNTSLSPSLIDFLKLNPLADVHEGSVAANVEGSIGTAFEGLVKIVRGIPGVGKWVPGGSVSVPENVPSAPPGGGVPGSGGRAGMPGGEQPRSGGPGASGGRGRSGIPGGEQVKPGAQEAPNPVAPATGDATPSLSATESVPATPASASHDAGSGAQGAPRSLSPATDSAHQRVGGRVATSGSGAKQPAVRGGEPATKAGARVPAAPGTEPKVPSTLQEKLGKGFKVREVNGKNVVDLKVGGKGFSQGTEHQDQALRILLERAYGDGLAKSYGGQIPTHALDAIENVIQNLKDPAIVEKIVGEKVNLLSVDPDGKTLHLVYNPAALDKLMNHGLKVATPDAGGTNTAHALSEARLGHHVADYKTDARPATSMGQPHRGHGAMPGKSGVRGGAGHTAEKPSSRVASHPEKTHGHKGGAGKAGHEAVIDTNEEQYFVPPAINSADQGNALADTYDTQLSEFVESVRRTGFNVLTDSKQHTITISGVMGQKGLSGINDPFQAQLALFGKVIAGDVARELRPGTPVDGGGGEIVWEKMPTHLKATVIDVLNRNRGIILDGKKVSLTYNPADLHNLWEESLTEKHGVLEGVGKKIPADVWRKAFSFEPIQQGSASIPHVSPADLASGSAHMPPPVDQSFAGAPRPGVGHLEHASDSAARATGDVGVAPASASAAEIPHGQQPPAEKMVSSTKDSGGAAKGGVADLEKGGSKGAPATGEAVRPKVLDVASMTLDQKHAALATIAQQLEHDHIIRADILAVDNFQEHGMTVKDFINTMQDHEKSVPTPNMAKLLGLDKNLNHGDFVALRDYLLNLKLNSQENGMKVMDVILKKNLGKE